MFPALILAEAPTLRTVFVKINSAELMKLLISYITNI